MKKYIVLFLLFSYATAFAQTDAKSWLDKMNNAYANAQSMSMKFQVEYYEGSAQATPTTTMRGEVRYSGANYYSDAMGEIVLVNKKYMLILDKSQHSITCLPGSGKGKPNDAASGKPDSSWVSADVKILKQTAAECQLEITGNDAVYEKTDITIDAVTFELKEIVFWYKQLDDGTSPKLDVKYSDVKFNSGITAADFSESKYIVKKNNVISGTGIYAAWKVIDMMDGKLPVD